MTEYLIKGKKEDCYGCSACEKACPKKAITLVADREGFLYPVINKELCVECGICKSVCPHDNALVCNEPQAVFAGQNKNNQKLMSGSSGSMFILFAEKILEEHGAVSGCVWDNNLRATHIVTEKGQDVQKMQGSKYVQSNLNGVFEDIKARLEKGQKVLFSGTPCQVDGLKRYLRKEYAELFTIDLICHGVPSPALLEKYIEELENSKQSKVTELRFRNKAINGWRSQGTIKLDNGNLLDFSPFKHSYYNLYYMENCVSRYSCYDCKFASPKRTGDVTIGDFWNASDFVPESIVQNGVSALLINTEKGKAFFEAINESLLLYESTLPIAQKGNERLVKGGKVPPKRQDFYTKVKELGLEKVADEYCKYRYLVPFVKKHMPRGVKKIMKKMLG